MSSAVFDALEVWRRLGLEELYEEVCRAQQTIQAFEQTLKNLPKCQKCARSTLLGNLQKSGTQLGAQLIGLGILSSALKDAVAAAERASAEMEQDAPEPCHCAGEPCSCHH